MMAVTPVCSHTLNARSIVISEEDRVKIGLLGKGLVTFDGDTSQKTGPLGLSDRRALTYGNGNGKIKADLFYAKSE